jgi:hypothetical protein
VPRYFFHISDGRRVLTDDTGREFSGLRAARVHAVNALRDAKAALCERELRDLTGWNMRVTDEHGRTVFSLGFDLRPVEPPIAPAVEGSRREADDPRPGPVAARSSEKKY